MEGEFSKTGHCLRDQTPFVSSAGSNSGTLGLCPGKASEEQLSQGEGKCELRATVKEQ